MTEIVNGLLLRKGEVLMAHRSLMRTNYPGTWSFPGGHVEDGETLDQALKRELIEEIGVQVQSCTYVQRFDDPAAGTESPVTFHFFAVEYWLGEPRNFGDEHTQFSWVKLDDAILMQGLTFSIYIDLFRSLMARLT